MVFYFFIDENVEMIVSSTFKGAYEKAIEYARQINAKKISLMEVM